MKKPFRETEGWKWIRTLLEMAAFVLVFLLLLWLFGWFASEVHAEKEPQTMWVICQPDDVVLVRTGPSIRSGSISELKPGTMVHTDGKQRNGFLHIVEMNSESGEGWVKHKYLVDEEPERVDCKATVVSKGRLAARRSIRGARVRWLKPGQTVTVSWITSEWCVTDKGYVMRQYLKLDGEND